MAFSLDERVTGFKTNDAPGPGTYFEINNQQETDLHPIIKEMGEMKRTGFTNAIRSEITMAGDTGFQVYNPGPGQYTSKTNQIGSRFVDRNNLQDQLQIPQNILKNKEIYLTNDKGMIQKNYQPMAADKTTRINLVKNACGPCPTQYNLSKPAAQIKSNAQQRIRQNPKWHQMIQTVPSIPDKAQVFFIADEERQDLALQNKNNALHSDNDYFKMTEENFVVIQEADQPFQRPLKLNVEVAPEQNFKRNSQGTIEPDSFKHKKIPVTVSNLDSEIATDVPTDVMLNSNGFQFKQEQVYHELAQTINGQILQKPHSSAVVKRHDKFLNSHRRDLKNQTFNNPMQTMMQNEKIETSSLITAQMRDSVGPAHYDPKIEVVRKSVKTPVWSTSMTKRSNACADNPGPGHYNQQQMSISIKQIKNLLISETSKIQKNSNKLQDKLNSAHVDEHRLKCEAYVQVKQENEARRGPGTYEILNKQNQPKNEVFQFFGSTSERRGLPIPQNTNLGPGSYDFKLANDVTYINHQRTKTAGFIGNRPENVFGPVPAHPGPAEYCKRTETFGQKYWSSSVQAFGQTEKRFTSINDNEVPAPGQYKHSNQWASKSKPYVSKVNKNRFRTDSTQASFKSTTDRTMSSIIKSEFKRVAPSAGTYEETRCISKNRIQGGAPNNFLLMKNERLVAPFQSTVKKGFLNTDKEPEIRNNDVMSSEEVRQLREMNKTFSTFSKMSRFHNSNKSLNFRIGPKISGPDMCTYNNHNMKSSFTTQNTFNSRLKQ